MYSDPRQQLNIRYMLFRYYMSSYIWLGLYHSPSFKNLWSGRLDINHCKWLHHLISTWYKLLLVRSLEDVYHSTVMIVSACRVFFNICTSAKFSIIRGYMLFNITTILKIHKQKKLFINHLYIFKFYMQRIKLVSHKKQTCKKM